MNDTMFWWSIAAVLLAVEVVTPMTVFIFPAIVAAIVALLSYFVPFVWVQAVVFFIGSGFSIALIRPLIMKKDTKSVYKQGQESLIGEKVIVLEEINNHKNQGRIKHKGDNFPARSIDSSIIPKDTWVVVESMDGITVLVRSLS